MNRYRLAAVAVLLCLLALVCAHGRRPARARHGQAGQGHEPRTPIKHFITLMQENHSFDNYFGTYPERTGCRPTSACPPTSRTVRGCVKPFHLGDRPITDLGHSQEVFQRQYRAAGWTASSRPTGTRA